MHLDIDGTGGAFVTSLQQLKRFEARISLFKSLDCPLALAAAGRNQRFTRYPPVINHNQGYTNPGYGLSLVDTLWNAGSYRQPLEQEGNPITELFLTSIQLIDSLVDYYTVLAWHSLA